MAKLLVAYKTKHGSTADYAKLIGDQTGADTVTFDDFDLAAVAAYDGIIVTSPTYMGVIQAKPFLEKNWDVLKDKKVFLLVTGVFPEDQSASQKSFETLPANIREAVTYAKVLGRFKMDGLSFGEKLVAKAVKAADSDNVSITSLTPVLEWAKTL